LLGHDAGEFAVGTILAKVSSPLPLVDGVEHHESEAVAATTDESVAVRVDNGLRCSLYYHASATTLSSNRMDNLVVPKAILVTGSNQ